MDDSLREALGGLPHARDVESVLDTLEVEATAGLGDDEVRSRRERHGRNRLREIEHENPLRILVRQFRSMIMLVLALAAGLSIAFRNWVDAGAIGVAIVVNAGIGFVTELRALRSMESLQELDRRRSRVRREGEEREIDAEELVPGDLLLLAAGELVTADARVVEANDLRIDESALTGESVPVTKGAAAVDGDTPLSERTSMLHKGTAVTRGEGVAVVVSTGMDTELGGVTSLVAEAESEQDPLSERLDALASRLVIGIVATVAVAGVIGWLSGRELVVMVETTIALFVAAVPEGLPIVATVALARGMQRMARRHALVRRLSAVQTLGSVDVLMTDKTGTLTENRMTVTRIQLEGRTIAVEGTGLSTSGEFVEVEEPDEGVDEGVDEEPDAAPEGASVDAAGDAVLGDLLRVGVLCSNASLGKEEMREDGDADDPDASERAARGEVSGDPTEVALLVLGAKAGLHREALLEDHEELRESPFDPQERRMATFHRSGADDGDAEEGSAGVWIAVKGAPDAVFPLCTSVATADGPRDLDDEGREAWTGRGRAMAEKGHRILALAHRHLDEGASVDDEDPYRDLTLLGLVGLHDPVREDVRAPVALCRDAGIRLVMVTGDREETAVVVAEELELLGDDEDAVEGGGDRDSVAGDEVRGPDDDGLDEPARERLLRSGVIFRSSPAQKLDLIALHQANGSIVGMTGDGVNDAPALKKADIGIAMGQRGEAVAADASDVILQDDQLDTVTMAVEQGRVIFGNVRRFVVYMISGNIGEILLVFLATVLGMPLPLLPLQILYINVVNDIFPALALGVGPGSGREMEHPPRDPDEPILQARHWASLVIMGVVIGGAVLGGFALCLGRWGMSAAEATTVSFLSVSAARLWHVFNMRAAASPPWRNQITANRWVWAALALCIGLLFLAAHFAPLANVLGVVTPDASTWLVVLGISLVPLVIGQALRSLRWA